MAEQKPGISLALGGGGARGFAHVGVIEALEAHNVSIGSIVGVSAGAVAGAGYALGYSTAKMREKVLQFAETELARHPRLQAMRSSGEATCHGLADRVTRLFCQGLLVKSFFLDRALLGADFFYEMVRFFLPPAKIEDARIPFAAVATDIIKGEPVMLDHGDLRRAVQASCSVPGVAEPVEVEGRYLIDGGAVCLVPTNFARQRGQGPVVAVNVDRNVAVNDLPSQAMEYYLRATEIQGYHLAQLLSEQADLALQPALGDVHWADFGRAGWIMDQGRVAGEEAWQRLDALLKPAAPWWKRLLRGERAGR
ncbi:MAG: patatin-like phospholipase family protein [Desulfarculaceae bacterium]|nr:patatin-like phospholipase family protein [Desulfarculaceae bacterium]MCF8071764.1 patatin-like phospholipase family protein [Desulfarculaceae bacterium]MCF8101314.1 patatin-like phospholipase family protein [Desulfarculaceae bacterium]MCF8117273.1 patatin-like phospholipase family protein [Desulfarculaceae bacterium]